MESLTLPEPAASLWAAKRGIVHAIPPEMFGRIATTKSSRRCVD